MLFLNFVNLQDILLILEQMLKLDKRKLRMRMK